MSKEFTQVIGAFISFALGVVLCYFLLPTKEVIKEVESTEQTKKIAELESKLKQKNNIVTYRTIYKDKIVEKIVDKTETDIDQKENETDTTQKDTEAKEVTRINKKYWGVEVGYDFNDSYYSHITYGLFNNLFIGGHGQIGKHNAVGLGIGVRL